VDLRSDTVSHPTAEMRKAMCEAVVGDDVYNEDPTVFELECKTAKLFDKEAALFVPTGTMGNLIALMVHCGRRGAEAIVGHLSHVYLFEQGGASQVAGVQLSPIRNNPDGTFCLKKFQRYFRGVDYHEVITTMAVVENTHNMCGGKVIPLEWLDEFTRICAANQILCHMDGARIFSAATYLGVSLARIARGFDSVQFCLSKNLSAPVGSMLVGTKQFIVEARRMRKVLGGGMRQVGVLAAAGLVALDAVVPLLQDDHRRVKRIAQAIYDLASPLVQVDIASMQTNICILHMVDPEQLSASKLIQRLLIATKEEVAAGVVDNDGKPIILKICSRNESFARLVTYHGVTDEHVDLAIKKIVHCIKESSE